MKLSTKIIYGGRFMVDLALNKGKGPAFLKDIAKRQDISEKYLWQLSSSLKRAGLVKAERGSKGGFTLAKQPRDISFKDVFIALEGEIAFAAGTGRASRSGQSVEPLLVELWQRLSDRFADTLAAVTLEDVAERYRTGDGFINYMI
jgi:Rrf2 family protein